MDYIYGKNAVLSYLSLGKLTHHVYLQKGIKNEELLQDLKLKNIPFTFMNKKEMNHHFQENHQGYVLEPEAFRYVSLEKILNDKRHDLIVIADQIEDPHNLGAILRTCDAVGVDGLIIPRHRSAKVNATVVKVSTGAAYSVLVHEARNIVDTLQVLKDAGFWIVAAENGLNAKNYDEIPVDRPLVLVVGSEGRGVSRLVLENSDILCSIPMQGMVNSLNVSVATGIMLYDIKRRR